jgi:hypothetical protein
LLICVYCDTQYARIEELKELTGTEWLTDHFQLVTLAFYSPSSTALNCVAKLAEKLAGKLSERS